MAKGKSALTGEQERPRGGRTRAVSEILPAVGAAAFKRFGFVQSSIVSRWPEIVGAKYAAVSAPESIRFPNGKRSDGTLTLTVASAHAPMMQHLEPVIIERVNRFFGYTAVARMSMRQGEIARAKAAPLRPALLPVPVELGESLKAIADPELKAVLESLAQGVEARVAAQAELPVIGKVR